MAKAYGTLTLFDQTAASQTVATFGETRAAEALQENLDVYNEIVDDLVTELADPTDDRLRAYGAAEVGEMIEADEHTVADAQRVTGGGNVGFPLYGYQYSIQWTRMWMLMNTVAQLEAQYIAARTADMQRIRKSLRRALFLPTNNLDYIDKRVDQVNVELRALVNGDSMAIPIGPNGETWNAATHSHYLANATLTVEKATELVETVVEHGHGANVRIYINRANEAAWRALTGFAPYLDARIIPASTAERAAGSLDTSNLYNRAIGLFAGAEVFVKPWIDANYAFAFDAGDNRKPLAFRTRAGGQLGQLQITAENESFPLRAQFMEREFGFGVWTRTNGAVLYFAGGSYVAPATI